MARGIDYGLGQTNIDQATGIRFGVIPQNDVQAWADSSESIYPDPEPIECESCGGSGDIDEDECEDCDGTGRILDDECVCECESIGAEVSDAEYDASCGDSGDIFITRSPYYTRAAFCSPCAPGACYLRDACEDGERAYCFGHDWFEGGVAPYPVYSVKTNEVVQPAKEVR